jgi:hypothetical protein
MADDAVAHDNLRRADLPALGGSRNQHGPPACAGLAHLVPGIGHRRAAAGALRRAPEGVVVALGVGRRAFDANLLPVGIEFVGQDGGQAGVGALPHFEVLGHDGHAVVGTDAQKGVRFESPP